MRVFATVTLTVCFAASLLSVSCINRKSGQVKGQTNAKVTFYGKAVDQNGQPLDGVTFEFLVESFPPDWTHERRGQPLQKTTVNVESHRDGLFQADIVGHILWVTKAEKPGFRHFYDLATGGDAGSFPNTAFGLNSWSDATYKSDPDHPAIYVFVKDGAHEVLALPCKGGYDSGNGTHWRLNRPGWPKMPSLKDVVWKQPTTRAQ